MTPSKNPGCLAGLLQLFFPAPKPTRRSAPEPVVPVIPVVQAIREPEIYPYRVRDDFLSPAEASFYRVARGLLGERMLIFPKVSLAEIFFIARPDSYQTYQNKIDRKRVDFLLCDPKTLKPVLGIELDDSSHRRPDRQERDAFVEKVFADAQLPLARIPVRMAYDTRELAAQFQAAMQKQKAEAPAPAPSAAGAPTCPKCGIPMVRRTSRRGNAPGQEFWGCANYPRCREMRALEPAG